MKYAKKGNLPYTLGAEMGRGEKGSRNESAGEKTSGLFLPKGLLIVACHPQL